MHIPSLFKISDVSVIEDFIKKNSFATLVVNDLNGKMIASHIPLELEHDIHNNKVIYGHISKANEIGDAIALNPNVLCIFQGPHAYISSGWYHHENVPTWNYMSVHVYGKIDILDKAETYSSLQKLMNKYEEGRPNEQKLDNYSSQTLKQLNGIIAFKINISEMQCAFKMSQNRNDKDYASVISALRQEANPLSTMIADEMNKIKSLEN